MISISAIEVDYYKNNDNYMLIDLRSEKEYRDGHIEGAKNIPYEIFIKKISDFPEEKIPVLYCTYGTRSMQAAIALNAAGRKVINVVGGIEAYRAVEARILRKL